MLALESTTILADGIYRNRVDAWAVALGGADDRRDHGVYPAAGIGYQWNPLTTRNVGDTVLWAEDYSNSSTRIGVQTFALTTGIRF